MTTWKRILLAACCMVFVVTVVLVVGAVPNAMRLGWSEFLLMFAVEPVFLFFASIGLVVFLPFIIGFKHADGLRFPLLLLAGTLLGPAALVLVSQPSAYRHLAQAVRSSHLELTISFPTTLLYLLVLRRTTRTQGRVGAT